MIISIIIPVYKVEKYIKRCLESIIAQECDEFVLECILIDDCTPDLSMEIANDIIAHYTGAICFKIIKNPENQGLSCSRNNGLKIAKGDYVFFLDSDDYITPNCLLCLYREVNRYCCNIDMIIGNSYDCHIDHYWQERDEKPYLLLNHIDIMRRFLQVELPMMAWNKLVRRKLLLDNHLFFRPHMIHEDELWSYELYNIVRSVVMIPEVTYFYELNEDSIMNSPSSLIRRVEGCHILVSNMLNTLSQELYVEKFFWGISMYMKSEAIIRDAGLKGEVVSKDKQLSRMLLNRSLADFRLSIFIFLILTIQYPFCRLIRYRWFRQKYYGFRKIINKLALYFDSFHHKKQ